MKPPSSYRSGKFGAALITALILLPLCVTAQTGGYAGTFSRLGFGPRGMAMGNALTATDSEGVYSYYNPALTAFAAAGNQVDISTSLMTFGRNMHSLGGTFRLPPSAGISLSLINANVGDIDGRDINGYPTGELSTHEYQLASAFGIRVGEKFSFGAGIKLNIANYHQDLDNASGLAIDLGLFYKASESLSFGVAARDLLASYSWNSSGLYGDNLASRREYFPIRLNGGLAWSPAEEIQIALDYGLLTRPSDRIHQLRMGGSYTLHEHFTLRAGWQIEDLDYVKNEHRPSVGFSVHLPFDTLSPSVDYAFSLEPNVSTAMHIFGLRLNL